MPPFNEHLRSSARKRRGLLEPKESREMKTAKFTNPEKNPAIPRSWLVTQLSAFATSLGRAIITPFSSLIIILIIGIALALPTGMYVLLQNIRAVSGSWNKNVQISLYLKKNISTKETQNLLQKLRSNPDVTQVRYISPDDGLKEFQKNSGFSNLLSEIKQNPLPAVVLIQPKLSAESEAPITQLVETLKTMPEVEIAQLDTDWVKRVYYLINLGEKALFVLFILLGMGVVLIVGNTIRLFTQVHLKEKSLLKSLGEIDNFEHSSFSYIGIWYGLFGSFAAWGIVQFILSLLQNSVQKIAATYGSDFYLQGLDTHDGMILLVIGTSLGLLGSLFAVIKHYITQNQ